MPMFDAPSDADTSASIVVSWRSRAGSEGSLGFWSREAAFAYVDRIRSRCAGVETRHHGELVQCAYGEIARDP